MPTTVTKNGSYRFELKHRNRTLPNAWSDFSYSGVLDFTTSTVLIKGDALPDWKARIRALRSATTPLTCLQSSCHHFLHGYGYTKRKNLFNGSEREAEVRGTWAQTNIGPEDPTSYEIRSVKNQAIQRMNQQIREAQTSLQGLVAAGELGESVRMVNGAGRQLYRGFRGYLGDLDRNIKRYIRYGNPINTLRDISGRYLEYTFGWKPLINDIEAGLIAIQNIGAGRMPIVHVRSKAKSQEKNPTTSLSQNVDDFHIERKVEKTWRYECKIYGVVGLDDHALMPHVEAGLTVSEFVPTLWELIPYSFLADYFVNIGAIIDAYSINKSGVKWLNLGELRACDVVMSAEVTPRTFTGWKTTAWSVSVGKPIKRSRVLKSRGVFSVGSLIPSLEFKIPGSSTRWCNISALAAQHATTSKRIRSLVLGR